MAVQRCQHIKTNGQQCGSPALRNRTSCYFHINWGQSCYLKINEASYNPSLAAAALTMPVLEDYESIQIAIMQVLRKLTTGHLDRKTAGLLLYGLQIASSNLRFAQFEPTIRESVVIDPMTTHMTPLDADQWSEEDDEDEDEDAEEDAGDENEIDGEDETEEDENPDDELGDDAELEEQEEESSGGVPPAVVSAALPCASAVGAAASPPGDSSNCAAGVGADAPVRAGAERAASLPAALDLEADRPRAEQGETKKPPQAEPKISDAQFFQALANLADHMENGTPLKFPVYPARPPASLDSEKNGKRKDKNGG